MKKLFCFSLIMTLILLAGCAQSGTPTPAPAPKPTSTTTSAPASISTSSATPTPKPAPASTTTAATAIKLKWSETSAPGTPRTDCVVWMKNEIEKRSAGRVKIDMFWSNTLFKDTDALAGVTGGIADIAYISAKNEPARFPLWKHSMLVLQGPGPREQITLAHKFLNEFPPFKAEIENLNLKAFSFMPFGLYQMMSKKPIRKLEDMKGMKIRGAGAYSDKQLAAVGAVHTYFSSSDAYAALQKGILDAAEYALDVAIRYSLEEVAKYMSIGMNRSPPGVFYMINSNVWGRLPGDIQQIFLAVGGEAEARLADAIIADEEATKSAFKKAGVEIIQFPDADMKRWANLPEVKALPDAWIGEMVKLGHSKDMATRVIAEYFK